MNMVNTARNLFCVFFLSCILFSCSLFSKKEDIKDGPAQGEITIAVDESFQLLLKSEKTAFENLYIPSAGHDAGISMGCALYAYNHILKNPRQPAIYNAYTGSKFSNEEIEVFLKERGIKYERLEDAEPALSAV